MNNESIPCSQHYFDVFIETHLKVVLRGPKLPPSHFLLTKQEQIFQLYSFTVNLKLKNDFLTVSNIK